MPLFGKDGAGHDYVELASFGDDRLRLTIIPAPSYDARAAVRFQIRNADGHLLRGPEIPVDVLPALADAFAWVRLRSTP